MEDGVTPCPRAARQMAAFDALPPGYRHFLANHGRTVHATIAAQLLSLCGGDVDEAISELRAALPVKGDA